MEWIDVKLHPELADAARQLAQQRDITVGQMVRDLLSREISKDRQARPPIRADERLIAPLRARLANDLAHAQNWADLDRRLASKGYRLVAAGGGLAMHERRTGRRVCKASELGFSYARLAKRFGTAFPGHTHKWAADRILPTAQASDDFEVIEPF